MLFLHVCWILITTLPIAPFVKYFGTYEDGVWYEEYCNKQVKKMDALLDKYGK